MTAKCGRQKSWHKSSETEGSIRTATSKDKRKNDTHQNFKPRPAFGVRLISAKISRRGYVFEMTQDAHIGCDHPEDACSLQEKRYSENDKRTKSVAIR